MSFCSLACSLYKARGSSGYSCPLSLHNYLYSVVVVLRTIHARCHMRGIPRLWMLHPSPSSVRTTPLATLFACKYHNSLSSLILFFYIWCPYGVIFCRQLHRDPNVFFAGYKLPHPLHHKIMVRVWCKFIFFSNYFLQPRFIQLYLLYLLCGDRSILRGSLPRHGPTPRSSSTLSKLLRSVSNMFTQALNYSMICCRDM